MSAFVEIHMAHMVLLHLGIEDVTLNVPKIKEKCVVVITLMQFIVPENVL